MFRWIIGSSLSLRYLLAFGAVILVLFGADSVGRMKVDVFPEFAPPLVEVQTEAPGLSTEEVEALVTVPLEQSIAGLSGLETMRSKTVPGLSSIQLIFERGTDLMQARQLVQERLAQAQPLLPNVAPPPVILQPLSATSRVVKVGVLSDTMSLIELSETYRWKMRPRLMSIPGVANIAAWGPRKRQLQVHADPEKLREHGVSLTQLIENVADSTSVGLLAYKEGARTGTGGIMDVSDGRVQIRHVLPVVTAEDLSKIALQANDGRVFQLGDVAEVVEGHPPMIGDGIVNDRPGLLLVVEKFPWANTLEVTRDIEAALEAMQPGLPGIEIDTTIFRPASFIEISIENLSRAMMLGSLMVVLVLVAFLYEWRAALISVVAIPVSLTAAAVVLNLSGATVNTMILAGFVIALGEVVDDAIIDIENITRRLRENRLKGSPRSAATVILEASLEIRSAVVFATLIIVLAISPVFFLSGLSGAFFQPLALSYVLALLASMVVALTITPALSLILMANAPLERRESPLVLWLQARYTAILTRVLKAPRASFGVVGAVLVFGLAILPLLGHSLLPSFKERDFLMHWVTKPGTSLPEMNRITIEASKELRAIPEVRNFGAHVGRAVQSDEVVGINFTENWVSIDPDADYDSTVAKIQEVVDGYPGLYRDVLTYLKERIREVLTGASEAIVIRLYGPDLAVLGAKAKEIEAALRGTDGIIDLHTEFQEPIPHIAIEVDLEAAERHAIKPGDVRRAQATLTAGLEVSDIYLPAQLYDIIVQGTDDMRGSVSDIRQMLVDTPTGGHVRLDEIADVRVRPTQNFIRRENHSRRLDVSANVRGRDLGSVVEEVEERLEEIDFPLEYHAEILGEYAEREAAQKLLTGSALIAAVAIFLLLQMSVGSWRLAAIAFLALPSALVGGVLATFLGGGVISLGSLVGFLTVLGISSRTGILLIHHCQYLEKEEGVGFGPGLVVQAARERLRPILMTALSTTFAILPLVVLGNIPGHEIEHPMAVVIIGGLVTSTLLNLFIMPGLYLRFGRHRDERSEPGDSPVEPVVG